MTTLTRHLIVTGATGKQGGALITALLSKPSQPFEIYAVTRNATAASAQRLAAKPNVHIIQGNFSDPDAIFRQVPSPWGLFSVTMPMDPVKEEKEGKAMTAAAVRAGVKHIVFTGTDRGKETETDPTPVPHFASKFEIERDVVARAKEGEFTYTFLRPVCFFDNMVDGFLGKAFVSMWRLNGEDSKLQMVATSDIGKVAAEAFLNAEGEEYRNQAISLAGDEFTPAQAAEVFKEVNRQEIPATYSFVGIVLKWLLHQHLGIMLNWFKSDGFAAKIPELKRKYPFLKDYRAWLETESAWAKKSR